MVYTSFTNDDNIIKEVFPTTAFEAQMRKENIKLLGKIGSKPKPLTKEKLLERNKKSALEL